jgi:hypothetical protein
MSDIANGFFGEEMDDAMNSASTTEVKMANKVLYPGVYGMVAVPKKFETKDGKVITMPNLSVAEKAGSLLLNFTLEITDDGGVEGKVNAGDYAYGMLVVAPNPKADKKKRQQTMNMTKPRLAALIGADKMEEFTYDQDWVDENLLAEFSSKKDKDGDYKLLRNSSMVKPVEVELVEDEYQGVLRLKVKSIRPMSADFAPKTTGISIESEAKDAFADDEESINKLSEGDSTAEVKGTAVVQEF